MSTKGVEPNLVPLGANVSMVGRNGTVFTGVKARGALDGEGYYVQVERPSDPRGPLGAFIQDPTMDAIAKGEVVTIHT